MAKVISIHSFRGGTGKSNTTANLAALYATQGLKVGVVDIDIQSPGIHVLFGVPGSEVKHSLNDYLNKTCSIEEVAHNVSNVLSNKATGQIFLVPASIKIPNIPVPTKMNLTRKCAVRMVIGLNGVVFNRFRIPPSR